MPPEGRRPVALRRSWLFLPGAERAALSAATASGADVLIQELEDFVPPPLRDTARLLIADTMAAWKKAGVLAAVRINPLHGPDGAPDLEAAMRGGAQIVLLPKTRHRGDIAELDRAITRWERAPDGLELAYVRQRFLVECVAAGRLAIDCPYTFSDAEGAAREARQARRLGYFAKSLVDPTHVAGINEAFTPGAEQVARARTLVEAFDAAQARGESRVELDGALVEVPTYQNARRLLARAAAFAALTAKR
jgi:citrate lyase subunit beta/citryl-CoA lyase